MYLALLGEWLPNKTSWRRKGGPYTGKMGFDFLLSPGFKETIFDIDSKI